MMYGTCVNANTLQTSSLTRKQIEDIQNFGMNMPFISSSEAKNAYTFSHFTR